MFTLGQFNFFSYYVQLGEDCSVLFDSNTGTIQGSVLGPILYALFVSPLFDLDDLINFADDNFCALISNECFICSII